MTWKSRQLQWTLLSGALALFSLAAIILFERTSMNMVEVLLKPWMATCRAVTPIAWQVRGNILLAMLWLFSGVVVYSMLASAVVIACLSVWQRGRLPGSQQDEDDQTKRATAFKMRTWYTPIARAIVSILMTLIGFTMMGTRQPPPHPHKTEEPLLRKVVNRPPASAIAKVPVITAYEGRIHATVVAPDSGDIKRSRNLTIRNQADYEAFVARIPKRTISKQNPSPPSHDPLLKKPFIDFSKHILLVAINPDSMYVAPQFESVLATNSSLLVNIIDPHPGETTFSSQPEGIGSYRALVIRKRNGSVEFQRQPGKPIPLDPKLVVEPLVARGSRAEVLNGQKPDATILKLIFHYHRKHANKQSASELFAAPTDKVRQQLLLLLESDDLLIWKHYNFNPANGSSSKNVYTTVLRLLIDRYGSKRECRLVQKFFTRILTHDRNDHMFFTAMHCCEFLEKHRQDSSVPVLVKALDYPGEYSLWLRGKGRNEPADITYTVRGEALHALETIAGDQISSYVAKGKLGPQQKPKEQWITEAKHWWTKLGHKQSKYKQASAELRTLPQDQPDSGTPNKQ